MTAVLARGERDPVAIEVHTRELLKTVNLQNHKTPSSIIIKAPVRERCKISWQEDEVL